MLEIEPDKLEKEWLPVKRAEQRVVPGPQSMWQKFTSYLRSAFILGNNIDKIRAEMKDFENRRVIDGVNFSRCQVDKIVADYNSERKLEIDCFSPYLSDYNLSTGEIWDDKLSNTDRIGLDLAGMLRTIFPDSRLVSLYDEYNTGMPDSTDPRGIPVSGGSQAVLSDKVRSKFKQEVERLLHQRGAVKSDEKEGVNFLLISESEKVQDAEKLVKVLESKGYIQRNNEEIKFINRDANNPDHQEILLRSRNGHWQCEALDASSFIKSENLTITHLVILPNHFKSQQDKVWEILAVLGIKPEHYHNIFYNENDSPEKVIGIIQNEINKYQ